MTTILIATALVLVKSLYAFVLSRKRFAKPHQIWVTLTARGATAYTAKYYTVRLRRLDRTGAVRRVGHGLYVAAETLELAPYAPATPWGGES